MVSLNKGIEFYIEDKTNMESYINYFGSSQLQTGLENYSQDTLANNVQALIGMYIDAWNKNIDSDPDIAASIVFANKLATDDDRRHITLGFRFLYNQFSVDGSNGTIKMFNCKK